MSFDFNQVDLDMENMMSDWPDALLYDKVSAPIPCIFEDERFTKQLDETENYDTVRTSRCHVRVAFLQQNGINIHPKKQVSISSREGRLYRIEALDLTPDRVEYVLELVDITK